MKQIRCGLLGVLGLNAFILAACGAPASEMSEYFKYPKTDIVITSGTATSKGQVSENFQYSRKQIEKGDRPTFRNGFGDRDHTFIGYEFVGRCDQGDVYVFKVMRDEKIEKVIPYIYSGGTATAVKVKDASVVLQPHQDKKES